MVDLAARVMVGQSLKSLGYGSGLYKTPPYYAVKVPVFSFEKLSDVNSTLGPEMKSTGEVLGIGKTRNEALFKGLTAVGLNVKLPSPTESVGVFLSVDNHDYIDVVSFAKKLADLGMHIYATPGTAKAIDMLDADIHVVKDMAESDEAFKLIESGVISYIVYTGALYDDTLEHYTRLHTRALQLSIACYTSLDTANVMADCIASRYTQENTELVDINNLRSKPQTLHFAKMQGCSNDYIFVENFDGSVTCPESHSVNLCDRHRGIGADGLVLIESSRVADAKMRIFNRDGTEGRMAGNSIRCVGKYLYDNGYTTKDMLTIETASGIMTRKLYIRNGKVSSVTVDMGKVSLDPADLPTTLQADRLVNYPVTVGGQDYRITCCTIGTPHCVVFVDRVDGVDVPHIGPMFENSPLFPQRVNTEFIRVLNRTTIKMRVWERGNGETLGCGTGACAAVVAAVENGLCPKGEDITVKLPGGDLVVNYTDERVTLTGSAKLVFEGTAEY